MLKPLGVLSILAVASVLVVLLFLAYWQLVLSIKTHNLRRAIGFTVFAIGSLLVGSWLLYEVAPKGSVTIAQLDLSEGRSFVLRYYRFGWFDYPKVRLYVRTTMTPGSASL